MEYKCNDCNKTYSGYQSLWIHNKKFHNKGEIICDQVKIISDHSNIIQNVSGDPKEIMYNSPENKLSCLYCNKKFTFNTNKNRHQRKCKEINNNTQIKIKELDLQKIKEEKELIILKTELELIKNNNQIIPYKKNNNQLVPVNNNTNNNHSHNTNNQTNNGIINKNNGTIKNTLNNTVNNNNNNTYTINKIGCEPIVFKTKDIKMIANDGMNGPITCARRLNFDKDKPENHSYCVTSLEGEYCKAINHETQQPEIVPKKEIIDQVFESAYNFIETIATQIKEDITLRDKLTNHEIKEIDRIVANKNKYYEKKNRKTFYNSINSMSYNYKDLVLSTWKLLKPLEENLITDIDLSDNEDDIDIDNEIKEVTEFPEDNGYSESDDEEVYCIKRDNNIDNDSEDEVTLKDLMKIS